MSPLTTCPLCSGTGAYIIWSNDRLRVIHVEDPRHPAYTRVIWQDHYTEMTQLPVAERNEFMHTIWQVEQAQRDILQPDKINLAQFGNMVPHLHWHIIPRWIGDSHFPEAIWAPAPKRSRAEQDAWQQRRKEIDAIVPDYHAAVRAALAGPARH